MFVGEKFTPKFNFSVKRGNYMARRRYKKNKNKQSLRGY